MLSTPTPVRRTRAASRLISLVAAALVAGGVVAVAAPAQAADGGAAYGYTGMASYDPNPGGYATVEAGKAGDEGFFSMREWAEGYYGKDEAAQLMKTYLDIDGDAHFGLQSGYNLLYVDHAHGDGKYGSWIARKTDKSAAEQKLREVYGDPSLQIRDIAYSYQPRGAFCVYELDQVRWDPYAKGYRCLPNPTLMRQAHSSWDADQADCKSKNELYEPFYRETTPIPGCTPCYYVPEYDKATDPRFPESANSTCRGMAAGKLVANRQVSTYEASGIRTECAPWERQTRTFAQPGPGYETIYDCYYDFPSWYTTTMGSPYATPGYYPPTTTAPDENGQYSAVATKSATETVTQTSTQTLDGDAYTTRGSATKKITVTIKGKKESFTGSAPIIVTAYASASSTASATATETASATIKCKAESQQAAQACADSKAQAAADKAATEKATAAAAKAARLSAYDDAAAKADAAAEAKLASMATPKASKDRAAKAAKAAAEAKARRAGWKGKRR